MDQNENYYIVLIILAMCMRLQSIIRIPNIRVATYLLGLFFLYDIFFVFITPYIFEKSIMVTVGTGGDSGESNILKMDFYFFLFVCFLNRIFSLMTYLFSYH